MKAIEEIVQAAQGAFWAKVVELVPEATSGDLDPLAVLRFSQDCRLVIEAWLEANTEISKGGGQ